MKTSALLRLLILPCLLLALASAKAEVTEVVTLQKALNRDGKVSLSNLNGSVKVSGWDRNEVQVVATKQASSERELKSIEIRVTSSPEHFAVETHQPERSWWSWGSSAQVRYELRVPKTAIVDQIDTVNGSVEFIGLQGSVRAETVNGSIRATNLSGVARFETVNGSIRVGLASLEQAGKCNFESVNGSITLGLPEQACAELRAETVNGSIRNEFGLPNPENEPGGESFRGILGDGTARVSASTVNGSIRFVKFSPEP